MTARPFGHVVGTEHTPRLVSAESRDYKKAMQESASPEVLACIETITLAGRAVEIWREGSQWHVKMYQPTQRNTRKGEAMSIGPSLTKALQNCESQLAYLP